MSAKLQNLKGFRDFRGKEALERQWLKNQIIKVFESWGYEPLETPTLEPIEIFEGQIGEDEKLFYQFEDQGGRRVALRYDQTVPACRVVGQYDIPKPYKRYQIQSAFRAEKPQKGRYREFLQCDADIFGSSSPLADAEVIALNLDIYKKLGFRNFTALINDRELLKDIPYKAIASIDKLKKIGREKVIADMVKKGISNSDAEKYLDLISKLKPNKKLEIIFDYLDVNGFGNNYKFEPTLARSFSYSTGPIWEIEIDEYDVGSVAGGERFDNLVKQISGKDVEGTGFAIGFDRTLEAARELKLVPEFGAVAKVLVTVFDEKQLSNSIDIANQLRDKNINTEIYPSSKTKLDKQLKYADKKQIPYVIIIGPEEAESNVVMLKNLNKKTQEKVALSKAVQILRES